jgi:hypothetical protein
MTLKRYLTAAVVLLSHTGAFADDFEPKIAAHLVPTNAVLKISETRTATDPQGRPVQVVCGVVSVRPDPNHFASSTFAYVIDDDKLWLTWKTEWLKEPQEMGVVRVMKYCPGN